MVKRSLFWLVAVVLLLGLVACGGKSAGSVPPTPVAARPTATQTFGPNASLAPDSGRPGTEVTITGSGWPANASITIGPLPRPGTTIEALTTVTAGADGSFSTRLILEKTPEGITIQPGRYDLAARSGNTEVRLPFNVTPPLPGGAVTGG